MGELGSHDAIFRNERLRKLRPCHPDVFEVKSNARNYGRREEKPKSAVFALGCDLGRTSFQIWFTASFLYLFPKLGTARHRLAILWRARSPRARGNSTAQVASSRGKDLGKNSGLPIPR